MPRPRISALLGLAVLLAGCVSVTPMLAVSMDDAELCLRYGNLRNTIYTKNVLVLRDEIKRRNLISDEFRAAVNNGNVRVGMTAVEALCTWGGPNRVNTTETQHGAHHQWVYETYLGQMTGSVWRFVYIENGKVTAVQH